MVSRLATIRVLQYTKIHFQRCRINQDGILYYCRDWRVPNKILDFTIHVNPERPWPLNAWVIFQLYCQCCCLLSSILILIVIWLDHHHSIVAYCWSWYPWGSWPWKQILPFSAKCHTICVTIEFTGRIFWNWECLLIWPFMYLPYHCLYVYLIIWV